MVLPDGFAKYMLEFAQKLTFRYSLTAIEKTQIYLPSGKNMQNNIDYGSLRGILRKNEIGYRTHILVDDDNFFLGHPVYIYIYIRRSPYTNEIGPPPKTKYGQFIKILKIQYPL